MTIVKIICLVVGLLAGGPIGGLIGFLAITVLDSFYQEDKRQYHKEVRIKTEVAQHELAMNLLVLSAILIKVDGVVSQVEIDYIRTHYVKLFGKERANENFKTFNTIIKTQTVSMQEVCYAISRYSNPKLRLQLLQYLFGVANADGNISEKELQELSRIAGFFRIKYEDFELIKSFFIKSKYQASAYEILMISESATNRDIKKAYRNLVKKYHPDKLTSTSSSTIKEAEEKFREVQMAYEQLQYERGF